MLSPEYARIENYAQGTSWKQGPTHARTKMQSCIKITSLLFAMWATIITKYRKITTPWQRRRNAALSKSARNPNSYSRATVRRPIGKLWPWESPHPVTSRPKPPRPNFQSKHNPKIRQICLLRLRRGIL